MLIIFFQQLVDKLIVNCSDANKTGFGFLKKLKVWFPKKII